MSDLCAAQQLSVLARLAVAKVRRRLAEVQRKRDLVSERKDGQVEQLEVAVTLIEGALSLLRNPEHLYLRLPDQGRQKMNQAVFEKLYVSMGMSPRWHSTRPSATWSVPRRC